MDISNVKIQLNGQKPAVYEQLHEKFNVEWDDGVIITVFPFIHCKFNVSQFPEKIVHEAVHLKQQEEMGPAIWWHKYLNEPSFRLEQEVQAYRKETQFITKSIKDRNARDRFIRKIAEQLSSEMYGKIITYQQALSLIR